MRISDWSSDVCSSDLLPIYDALFQQEKIRHILVRHERAATHAAEGYARATGKPGVVLVTSGPGATNAITGITAELMDSLPIVVISGQVPTERQSVVWSKSVSGRVDVVGALYMNKNNKTIQHIQL